MDDDPALVTAAQAGNRNAFATLYDRYAGLVRALCIESTGTVVDAQDLAQEVFLNPYKRLADLRDHEQFGSWVAAMARLSLKQWLPIAAPRSARFCWLAPRDGIGQHLVRRLRSIRGVVPGALGVE